MAEQKAAMHSAFWDDFAEDLQDPEHRRHFTRVSERIARIDRAVNQLEDTAATGLPKAP